MRAVCAPINLRRSERGIALVITLILLSVTLVMAIAFLAISRRERGSVLTETDTVTARLAADSGLANAEAQILATVLQATNTYNFGLLVSTNYVNANGFVTGFANPTNVNYDHYFNGATPLSVADFKQNIANLWYLPRAPVFAYDRTSGTNEFRFYLDLNRNLRYDPNGPVPMIGQLGGYLHPNGLEDNNPVNVVTNFELGDPEWVGVLERPDAPHGPNNKFLSRYAFIAMPAGNTLDLNAIHNQALHGAAPVVNALGVDDTYFRNQGVGGWEINLAAFLADLNTNEWNTISSPYNYARGFNINNNNTGVAFDDARALLAYRYNNNYGMLATFRSLFPNYPVAGGAVDLFPFGPLTTTSGMPFYASTIPIQQNFWPGAASTNHYFALASDLFDPNKAQTGVASGFKGFIDRLQFASTNVSTYDRYTFYRLLAQLGTDSAPESDRINVNYLNVDSHGNIVADMQTNSIPWEPAQFFTNAADRMLRAYTTKWFQAAPSNYLATYYGIHTNYFYNFDGNIVANDPNGYGLTNIPFVGMTNELPIFGVANIPVFVNSNFVYRPAVHRLLQLAANIYDATTNNAPRLGHDYPSVMRPTFVRNNLTGDVFVNGYREVSPTLAPMNPGNAPLDLPVDVTSPFLVQNAALTTANGNVYGVPWIIGAKKGFPSFNEISLEDVVQVSRKLLVTRSDTTANAALVATNSAYVFSISNSVGVEFWNPYTNSYNDAIRVVVNGGLTMNLTNAVYSKISYFPFSQDYTFGRWPGSIWRNDGTLDTRIVNSSYPTNAFYIPINFTVGFMTNEIYKWLTADFQPAAYAGWETSVTTLPPLPHFGLVTTNRLQAYILANNHIIDYVQFNGPDTHRDLNAEIQTTLGYSAYANMWDTNMSSRGPWGIVSQMGASQGSIPFDGSYWGDQKLADAEIDGFFVFMGGNPSALPRPLAAGYLNVFNFYVTNTTVQVPFTPQVTAYDYTSWQANDPLVHTLSSDLVYYEPAGPPKTGTNVSFKAIALQLLPNIGALNDRYKPWGQVRKYSDSINNPYDTTLKDPLVRQSDDWAFPTNKLPSVGWLGRIHRGSPWQTVYLKATNLLSLADATTSGYNTWRHWTGNGDVFDITNTAPVQDRILFDLFSTSLNDNASRGQLPINVAANDTANPAAGIAAWSAVFSGMAVPTNRAGAYTVINPAGANLTASSPLYAIVANINNIRKGYTNATSLSGAFKHVGDILSVPALSQSSPFLKGNNITNNEPDALMEWLPQQTMSLLRVSDQPRFVVYSYGQTLAPAPNGIVTSGTEAGMVTNYQVTAETVTRSVIRVEGAPTNTHAVVESYNILPPD